MDFENIYELLMAAGNESFSLEPDAVTNFVQTNVDDYDGWEGKHILDFGSGHGVAALGMALKHPGAFVTGVDLYDSRVYCLSFIKGCPDIETLPGNLDFFTIPPGGGLGNNRYDLIYSWSVMEHVSQPVINQALSSIYEALKFGGLFLLQISPLYYTPNGHHLYGANIGFYEHLIMQDDMLLNKLRENCPSPETYEQLKALYQSLNKLTIPVLKEKVLAGGFNIIKEYTTKNEAPIPEELLAVYRRDVLETEQIVFLCGKN